MIYAHIVLVLNCICNNFFFVI